MRSSFRLTPLVAFLVATAQPLPPPATLDTPGVGADGYRWWKGNLHTHSLWSDGDQFPEVVVDWYALRFIGTRRGYDPRREPKRDAEGNPLPVTMDYSEEIGRVLQEVEANQATYTFTGDELYVRARIRSSRLKENPFAEGEREQAWTQPVVLPTPPK